MFFFCEGLWTLVPAAGHRRLPAEPRGARAAQRKMEVVPQGKIDEFQS